MAAVSPRRLQVLLTVAVLAAGCSSQPGLTPRNSSNLVRLASLYGVYASQHNNVGPANEQEFKKFILAQPPEGLKTLGIDPAQIDQFFTSPRDNQPFRILYRVRAGDPTRPPVIAYEQTGSGGTREVAFLFGKVEEVDEARFRQLVPKP
jgi:hypothetical protein